MTPSVIEPSAEPNDPCAPDAPPVDRSNDLAVVSFVLAQMTLMEGRLMGAIKTHSDAETERWGRHESDHLKDTALFERFAAHIDADEKNDLVLRARLEPVQKSVGWIRREWRTIMLTLAIVAQAILGVFDRARIAAP